MFKHVFVTTDGSALGNEALPLAARLAATCNATLTVALAVPDMVTVYEGPYIFDPVLAHEEQLAAGRSVLYEAALTLDVGIRTCLVDARGEDVATALVQAAQREHADVIVMSTHGRSGLKHVLLGSVAERVVHRSEIPVLLQRQALNLRTPVPDRRPAMPAP